MLANDRVRIGNQTSYRAEPILSPFQYAVQQGFDAFEWFPDRREGGKGWEASDLDTPTRQTLRQTAIDHDIRLSVHVPLPADPLNPVGFDAAFRLAEDLGARVVNVHMNRAVGADRYAEAIAPWLTRSEAAGLILTVENIPADVPDDFNHLFAQLSHASLGMCLDIGHANMSPATRGDHLAFLDQLDPTISIRHIHAHGNRGDRDSHIPLFTDPEVDQSFRYEDWTNRLARRNFRGNVVFEYWPEPRDVLNRGRDGLQRYFAQGIRS